MCWSRDTSKASNLENTAQAKMMMLKHIMLIHFSVIFCQNHREPLQRGEKRAWGLRATGCKPRPKTWEAYQCLFARYAPLSPGCETNLKVKSSTASRRFTWELKMLYLLMRSGKANSTVKVRPLSKDNKVPPPETPKDHKLHCSVYLFYNPECRG